MNIRGVNIDPDKLLSKDELLKILHDNGEHDRGLSHVRERYQAEFGNELIWRYPITDGMHMGTFIVVIKEGFISLPFDEADSENYEVLVLDDAAMFDDDAMDVFITDWRSFSEDLLSAMFDMLRILRTR